VYKGKRYKVGFAKPNTYPTKALTLHAVKIGKLQLIKSKAGWSNYYGLTNYPAQLRKIEAYIRRRLGSRLMSQPSSSKECVFTYPFCLMKMQAIQKRVQFCVIRFTPSKNSSDYLRSQRWQGL